MQRGGKLVCVYFIFCSIFDAACHAHSFFPSLYFLTMKIDSEQRIKMAQARRRLPPLPEHQERSNIDFEDPASYRPLAMGAHAALLWPHAIMQGWMTKHMPPAFSFMKTRHRRYVLLLDRMLYTFKTDKCDNDFREFFELSPHTNVFVTDQFPSILYCIEIQRKEDGRTWYLEADNTDDLKLWLDRLKKTINWLKQKQPGVITLQRLMAHHHPNSPSSPSSSSTHSSAASRRPSRLPDVLPPQLPPPTSRPPPPPIM